MQRFNTLFNSFSLCKLITTSLILLISHLSTAADIQPAYVEVKQGKEYYTRYNFMYEKGRHVTTNYWRGELVPINTKVTLVSIGSKKMVLDIDGQEVAIVNVKKHSKKDMGEIASKLLSPKQIPISKVSSDFRDDLESGVLRIGMTKEEVLMTRGYPPAHKTPSTKSTRWTYWSSKFIQRTLVFKDGKLVEGRGIY